MAKKKTVVIQRSEWEKIPDGFGHGVEFHTDSSPRRASLVAFLDGYEWLHRNPKVVPIFIRKADDTCPASFLMKVKKQIENALKSGKRRAKKRDILLFRQRLSTCAHLQVESRLNTLVVPFNGLPSLLVSSQGQGLIDLPLRASNEESPQPRVARA